MSLGSPVRIALSRMLVSSRRLPHTAAPKYLLDPAFVNEIASQGSKPPSVERFLQFGNTTDPRRLVKSAQYLHRELAVRLATCIALYNALPFIAGCNPHLQRVYEMYADALRKVHSFPPILTAADEVRFTQVLENFVDHHMVVPSLLASACQESRGVVPPEPLTESVNAIEILIEGVYGQ